MKIAIIGAGNVGSTLAKKWIAARHDIVVGALDPQKPETQQKAQEIGANVTVVSPQEAAQRCDIVLLAVPWVQAETAVKSLGNLKNKILIDCTNPLKKDLSGLTVGFDSSGGECVQKWAPEARVVKSFHTTGFNIMADPILDGKRAVMFYCGNDEDAKKTVKQLIVDVGFEPTDAGPLESARLLEPYALLWISSAYRFGLGRDFAFGLLKR